MAERNKFSVGVIDFLPMTCAQINALDAHNGMVAFCSDDKTSGACLVSYQDSAWIVVETGAAMSAT
jgi:hypothetical protein